MSDKKALKVQNGRFFWVALLSFIFVLTGQAHAQSSGIERFLGHFSGSGISENADSIFFAVSVRDIDVTISAEPNGGFKLDWVTITREGGDPNNPSEKRKQTTLVFNPTDRPGVFRASEKGDPLEGSPVWWSRIDGDTLYTYMMMIEDDGSWQVQKYARTVSGSGMTLLFERLKDGEATRQVKGRLVKTAG